MTKELTTVCPQCRGALSSSALRKSLDCRQCHAVYPLIDKEVPILVRSPGAYLASQALGISQALANTRKEIKRLERLANKHPGRSKELLEWGAALHTNVELLRELRDKILPYCTSAAICEAAAMGPGQNNGCGFDEISQALALARRDWGGEEACEQEIMTLVEAAVKMIDASFPNPIRTLVLGSGMGRMAEELSSRYEQTCAIELLLPMELLRRKLHRQPVSFNIVDPRNRRLGSDIIRRIEIAGRSSPNGTRCDFVVGDARHAPWPDGFFSCIVSAYFSDVVPYSMLLQEITRLLQPKGILVHIGPLAYHHQETGEHLAADQFVTRLKGFGYSILQTDWIKTTLRGDPTSMYSHTCDNLVLTARKTENVTINPQELEMDSVLGFQEGVTLSTQVKICNESATILKSELKIGSGNSVALSPLATRMVEAIDGKDRFGDILTKLASMLGTEYLPQGELDKLKGLLVQLLEEGTLRLLPRK